MITEYHIEVSFLNHEPLIEKVQDRLANGWQLVGPMTLCACNGVMVYAQTLVKEVEVDND